MVTVPGFLVPGLLVPGLLVPGLLVPSRVSAPTLTRVLTTGQEEHNKPESSAAKLYCLHLQEQERKTPNPKNESPLLTSLGARAPARQSESARSASKRAIVYIF